MSESAKTIIKFFCDRFLDLDYYPTNLKTILDLELGKLKGIKKDEIEKFKKIDVFSIRDLTKLENYGFENLIEKLQIDKNTLNNALISSTLISNAWNKRNLYLKKPKLKVVVAGLDFAGKTSLINRLMNDYNYNDMASLEPTIGANVEEYQSDKLDLILWDLGGQKDHVDEYLSSPEKFFIQIDILIFVIDSQDDIRYLEAVKYLQDIINILEFLKENPFIVVLLNKADFDLREDPDFQIRLEYLADKISKILNKSKNIWKFEIIPTSIYNFYYNEPEIVKSIKNIFSKNKEDTKKEIIIPDIEAKFQKILDLNLKLMDKFVSELSEIKRALLRLNPSVVSQSLFSVPFKKVKSDYISPDLKKSGRDKKRKKKVKIDESQKIKKHIKGSGPPKPLSTHPSLKLNTQKVEKDEKLTGKKLKEIKASLKQKSELSIKPSAPPVAPKITSKQKTISIESLKPPSPPLPPKISFSGNIRSTTPRSQILSELKDMFLKRGLINRYDL
ncbi:MAG: ADP-ribosylation factor-like protein [Promethearchaeota archaeon]